MLDGLEHKFQILAEVGIKMLRDLISALKDKKRLVCLPALTGIDEDYLNLLRREANGYLPNPHLLEKLAGFPSEVIRKLSAEGIKNTRQLFERIKSLEGIIQLYENETGNKRMLTPVICSSVWIWCACWI